MDNEERKPATTGKRLHYIADNWSFIGTDAEFTDFLHKCRTGDFGDSTLFGRSGEQRKVYGRKTLNQYVFPD